MNPKLDIEVGIFNTDERYFFIFKVKGKDHVGVGNIYVIKYSSPMFDLKDKEKVYNETMATIIKETYKILFPL